MQNMNIVSGTAEGLPGNIYSLAAAYRYKVFVERLGWQLSTQDGIEQDQFDRSDTLYVVARNELGEVCGCARLLPTTRPYLLSEVFPQLLNGVPPPSFPEVWELSRFAAIDLNANTTSALGDSSPIVVELLKEAMACATARGANRLIMVVPIGVERILQRGAFRRAGFHTHRAGPPTIIDGNPIFACWITCESSGVGGGNGHF